MPSAQKSILFDIIMYMVYLWIIVTVITFIIGMISGRSCCGGPANAYEHFQDAGTIDRHLYSSVINMSSTFDTYTQKLDTVMNGTTSMKAQTCSIYDSVHNKFIKSVAADAPDESEYQLSKQQQTMLRANRAKNAEVMWLNQVELFKVRHQESAMIDCSQVSVADSSNAAMEEGFADAVIEGPIAPATIENALQNLIGKFGIFKTMLESKSVQRWLDECRAIKGTANFLSMYVHNVLIQAQMDKCKGDYIKIKEPGFKNMEADDQEKTTKQADMICNAQYGSQFENFENPPYVNTQFSFPVPFPVSAMSPSQKAGYDILSAGQNLLNMFATKVGTTYQDAMAAYRRMNERNNTYIQFKKQIDSVSDKNYSRAEAEALN